MRDERGKPVAVVANLIARAHHGLGTQELRLFYFLVSQVEQGDEQLKPVTIHVRELAKLWGRKTCDSLYAQIEKVADRMLSKVLHLQMSLEGGKTKRVKHQWLTTAEYHDSEGKITLMLHPCLAPYLLALKARFTYILPETVNRFRSSYAVRFYEQCATYRSLGRWQCSIEELRELMDLEDGTMPHVANIKQRIIDRAKVDLEQLSELYFSYQEIKRGRKVVGWDFFIHQRERVGTYAPEAMLMRIEDEEDDHRADAPPLPKVPPLLLAHSQPGETPIDAAAVTLPPPPADVFTGRPQITFEDLESFIHELFTPKGAIPKPLNDDEERGLRRLVRSVVPDDLTILRRYRREDEGRLSFHKQTVLHTSRRDTYIKCFASELSKAQGYYGLLPGGSGSTTFLYGNPKKARPALPDVPEAVPVEPIPVTVAESAFEAMKLAVGKGAYTNRKKAPSSPPSFQASDSPAASAATTTITISQPELL